MAKTARIACRAAVFALMIAPLAACAKLDGPLADASCAEKASENAPCADRARTDSEPVGSIPSDERVRLRDPELRLVTFDPATETAPLIGAEPSRAKVLPEVRLASREIVAAAEPMADPLQSRTPESRAEAGKVGSISLDEAVAVAVLSHPLMGAQAAKVRGAVADKHAADALTRPNLEVFAGAGQGTFGSYANYPSQFGPNDIVGAKRGDLGFTFKQLIFDFGVAASEAARSKGLIDSERLRLADQAEDIALRTVNAYLNLLESKELLAAIDQSVARKRSYSNLVKLSEENGASSRADLDRIMTKVIEAEALRTDVEANYQVALDEFRRLTGLQPKQVRRPKAAVTIPESFDAAIALAMSSNPSILALRATGASLNHQLEGVKAQKLPRVDLQSDALVKHYLGGASAAREGVLDMRAMLTVSYKILDGGLLSAQSDRVRSNMLANDFKQLDERETLELNLRRLYETLRSSAAKSAAATRGLATARSVADHYAEQFKAGRRSAFELLDSDTTVFSMEKNRINGEYEELRSRYGILRQTGRLTANIGRG